MFNDIVIFMVTHILLYIKKKKTSIKKIKEWKINIFRIRDENELYANFKDRDNICKTKLEICCTPVLVK